MDKHDLKGLSWVFGIILIIAFKLGIGTSIKIHAQNMTHSGWNDAKEELRLKFSAELGKETDFPAELKKPFLDCMVEKSITFLNHTVCSYLYNPRFTKKEEHIATQDACLAASGYNEAEVKKISIECVTIVVDESLKNMKKEK